MRKKIVIGMWLLVIILSCLLIVLGHGYWYENMYKATEQAETVKQIEILCTYEEQPLQKSLCEIIDEYAKSHSEVEILIRFIEPANFQKEICLDKDEDTLADIIICDNVMTPALVSMGIFQDMSEYMDIQKADEYIDAAYNTAVVNGRCYAIPFTCDPYVLFYNKEYYRKNKLKLPNTMEELNENLKAAQTLGNYNFAMACKNDEELAAAFLQMVYLYGGNILDLDGEGSRSFFHDMQDYRDNDIMPVDMVNWNQQDLMHYFQEGMVMTVIARLSSRELLEQEEGTFLYGIMEIPYRQNQAYLFHGENIGVTVDGSEKEVWELLDYLTTDETAQRWSDITGKLSVRVDNTEKYMEIEGLSDDFFQRQRNQSIAKNSYSSWFLISSAISEQMIEFMTSSVDAETAAHNMQEAVREAIMER